MKKEIDTGVIQLDSNYRAVYVPDSLDMYVVYDKDNKLIKSCFGKQGIRDCKKQIEDADKSSKLSIKQINQAKYYNNLGFKAWKTNPFDKKNDGGYIDWDEFHKASDYLSNKKKKRKGA